MIDGTNRKTREPHTEGNYHITFDACGNEVKTPLAEYNRTKAAVEEIMGVSKQREEKRA